MGNKRVIDTGLWDDKKVLEEFSPEDKYFWLFLLTNPKTNLLGVYRITVKEMSYYLDYTKEAVAVLLERFENKYRIIKYQDGELAIKNYLLYGIVKGGKPVEDCLIKNMSEIKHKDLIAWCFASVRDHVKEYGNVLNETVDKVIENFININNLDLNNYIVNDTDTDNDNEYDRIVPRIVPRIVDTPKSHSKSTRFQKPTIDEIKDYVMELCEDMDAERFFDYYESNGWKVSGGRASMKDWKATVRGWIRREKEFKKDKTNIDDIFESFESKL